MKFMGSCSREYLRMGNTSCRRVRMSHSQGALEELHSGQMELQVQEPRSEKGAEVGGKNSVGLKSLAISLREKIR